MKKALLILSVLATIGIVTFMGASYLLLTHPILSIGAVVVGFNIVIFSMFKLG